MTATVLPWIDVASLAYEAGFRGEPHATVVALSQPESGRQPRRENLADPNGGSFGLLQINGAHDPDAAGSYPNLVPTPAWIERMKDPLENLKMAYRIWLSNSQGERNFKPWGAYTSNLHLASLDAARCALDARARLASRDASIAGLKARLQETEAEAERARLTAASLQARIDTARVGVTAALAALEG